MKFSRRTTSSVTTVLLGLILYVTPFARGQCEVSKLVADDGAADDRFGSIVSIGGDLAVVGARGNDEAGADSGAAYVYRREGIRWVFDGKLRVDDPSEGDEFGWSVSVSGGYIAASAHKDDDHGLDSGSVYVFHRIGGEWVLEDKFSGLDTTTEDLFGSSLFIDGERLIVGARWDDDNGNKSGSAYIFRREGTEWVEEAKLTGSEGAAADQFGWAVSLHGDRAVVGAIHHEDLGVPAGAAYVFRREGEDWVEEAKLIGKDVGMDDHFGRAVSILGGRIAVGQFRNKDPRNDPGAAYVFRLEGTEWVREAKLLPSDATPFSWFGQAVSLSGARLLVGGRLTEHEGVTTGAAYVYVRTGKDWEEEFKLTASDGASFDNFGVSASLSGDYAMVGSFRDDDVGMDSGSAYVFAVAGDCNDSGSPDACDILEGTSGDCNHDGLADECGVDGDFDGNGEVNLFDFAAYLGCFSGPGGGLGDGCEVFDFDFDLDVDFVDFVCLHIALAG